MSEVYLKNAVEFAVILMMILLVLVCVQTWSSVTDTSTVERHILLTNQLKIMERLSTIKAVITGKRDEAKSE